MPDLMRKIKQAFGFEDKELPDDNVVRDRQTGGVDSPDEADQHSTTGTTPNETYVGRVSGADPGYAGETGGERRAKADGKDTTTGA